MPNICIFFTVTSISGIQTQALFRFRCSNG